MKVEVKDSNDQCITCSVSFESKQYWLSAVNGANEGSKRKRLWKHLISIKRQLSQEPWVLAGDFNIITDPSESTSYNGTQRMTMETKEFNECLQQLEF